MQRFLSRCCQTLQYRIHMKQTIPLSALILSILIIASCHRSKSVDDKKVYSNSLEGAWELRELRGGMIAGLSPYYSPGNGQIRAYKDSSFKFYVNGKLTDTGTFTLTRDTCPATHTLMDAYIISTAYGHKTFFGISKDTLTLYDGVIAADGTIAKYVRINNTD